MESELTCVEKPEGESETGEEVMTDVDVDYLSKKVDRKILFSFSCWRSFGNLAETCFCTGWIERVREQTYPILYYFFYKKLSGLYDYWLLKVP